MMHQHLTQLQGSQVRRSRTRTSQSSRVVAQLQAQQIQHLPPATLVGPTRSKQQRIRALRELQVQLPAQMRRQRRLLRHRPQSAMKPAAAYHLVNGKDSARQKLEDCRFGGGRQAARMLAVNNDERQSTNYLHYDIATGTFKYRRNGSTP